MTLKCGLGHSRSLKVVPFESLDTVFYSPSIITMAISLAVSVLAVRYSASSNGLTMKSEFGVDRGN